MEKLRKILIVLAILTALLVGIVTTAMASYAAESDVDDGAGEELTLEEKKAAIEASTPISQYALPVIVGPFTWDNGSKETLAGNWTAGNIGQMLGNVGVNFIGAENDPQGNPVFTLRYDGAKEKVYEITSSTLHTYAYINVNKRNQANNLVMEFDITTFGDSIPGGMAIEHSTVTNDAGGRAQPRLLEIGQDGSLTPSLTGKNCQSGYELTAEEKERLAKHVITKDKWMHITMLYNSETCFVTLYIDYEYICTFDTRPKNVSHYELTIFRFGSANQSYTDGEISIDNFVAYEGSYIRTPDLLSNMSEHEQFIFYVNCLNNDKASITDKVFAYNIAKKSVDDYWNDKFIPVRDPSMDADALAELNANLEVAVNNYNIFINEKYDELYSGYIADNLRLFEEHVNKLHAINRSLSTIDQRKTELSAVNAFFSEVGENILKSEESNYFSVKAAYDDYVNKLNNDELTVRFCTEIDNFYLAMDFSVATLQRRFARAEELLIQIDTTLNGTAGFERFTEAMTKYKEAGAILENKVLVENSNKIIDCVSFIDKYTTVEEWAANYEYINRFIVIIREVVRENKYDTTVEGVNEALEFYYRADGYFYGLLQAEHLKEIRRLLDLYIASDGYVEKVGICAHVDAYIASADIDRELPEIAAAIVELETYKAELEQYKTDYNDVLVQNTAIFKNTMRSAMTATTYADRLAFYEVAHQLYFAMNAGDESIAEELAYYDELTAQLAEAQQASAHFILAVEALKLATDDDALYAALVDCYILSLSAEPAIDGVSEAMDYFLAEYNAYNASIGAVNDELSGSYVAVGSLRANCGVREIIAIIIKRFGE